VAKKLHFGVTDVPYPYGSHKSTHEVANILEAKYQVIENFVRDNEKEIRAILKEQAKRNARSVVAGRKPSPQGALDQFKKMFKTYILKKQLDGRVRGVPTLASLRGVNHRLKHPYAKRAPRPSFFDTGLYVSVFKAWIAEE
jgi:hypothetical protein